MAKRKVDKFTNELIEDLIEDILLIALVNSGILPQEEADKINMFLILLFILIERR